MRDLRPVFQKCSMNYHKNDCCKVLLSYIEILGSLQHKTLLVVEGRDLDNLHHCSYLFSAGVL